MKRLFPNECPGYRRITQAIENLSPVYHRVQEYERDAFPKMCFPGILIGMRDVGSLIAFPGFAREVEGPKFATISG